MKEFYQKVISRLGLSSATDICQIYLPNQELIYIPIPKNACSSTKHALYEIEFNKKYDYDENRNLGYRDIHNYYAKRANAKTNVKKLLTIKHVMCFTIVRDPIKRLISCYRNRVVDIGDLKQNTPALEKMNLPVDPDINTFILNLDSYWKYNTIIAHHSKPQALTIGSTLKYFDKIFTINDMPSLLAMLRNYKPDLEMRKDKSGGSIFGVGDLSISALERAIDIYAQDYRLLDKYFSPQTIIDEYKRCKESV